MPSNRFLFKTSFIFKSGDWGIYHEARIIKYQDIDFLYKENLLKAERTVADFVCCGNSGYKGILP